MGYMHMTARYSIYCYVCPLTGEVFYVGQDSKRGFRGDAITEHNHGAVQHKLRRLLSAGLRPTVVRLCQFETLADAEELNRAEVYWVDEGRRRGWPLLNVVDGGRVYSGWACDEETRMKISLANTGKKRTPEQRTRMSAARIGHKQSQATCDRRSATLSGRPLSASHKNALRASWYDHHDETTRQKISATKRGKARDQATRAKISASLKGRPWSEARRAAQKKET